MQKENSNCSHFRTEHLPVSTSIPTDLYIVVNSSDSMGGKLLADNKSAIISICNVLQPSDTISITAFDNEVHEVVHRQTKKVIDDVGGIGASTGLSMLNSSISNGATLYDAIVDRVDADVATQKNDDCLRRHAKIIVLTDGKTDNKSTLTFENACSRLQMNGVFHFILIITGEVDEKTNRRMEQLCNPPHCTLVSVTNCQWKLH